MAKNCKIYGLFSTQNPQHIRYVGQTVQSVESRLKAHVYDARKSKTRRPVLDWITSVQNRGHKVGVVTLNKNAKWEKSERYYIKKLKLEGNKLLNLTDGGEGTLGWKPSKKWREEVSERNSGRLWSEERKKERKDYLKNNHPMKGRKHSEESKEKMREIKLGKVLPQMTSPKSEEHRKKIGEASRKRLKLKHHMKGKKHSEETKRKISKTLLKRGGKCQK